MEQNPVRFRLTEEGDVVLEGRFIFQVAEPVDHPVVVFTLNEGYRPEREVAFNQPCETGRTIVTVRPDGGVLANQNVGWIGLNGVRFRAA